MSIPYDRRTTREQPCPACGHPEKGRFGHCFFLEGKEAVWCANAETFNGRRGIARKEGWVHRLVEGDAAQHISRPRPAAPRPAAPPRDFEQLHRAFHRQLTPAMARAFSFDMGVNVTSLRRLGLGWATRKQLLAQNTECRSDGCWTFPMRNAAGDVVGIRLRSPATATAKAFKYAVDGSDGSGLFIPAGLEPGGQLLVPEGPTSLAALLTLGFAGVGRPAARSGIDYLRALVARLRPARVVVVGDNDKPDRLGRRAGQDALPVVVAALRPVCRDVAGVLPPPRLKDSRDWLQDGANAAEVQARIEERFTRGKEAARSAG